jgi:hypothetical protein
VRQTGKLLVVLAVVAGPASGALSGPAPAAAAPAASSAYQQVLRVYEASGAIAPCRFTAPELQSALGSVDTYGAEYFADFTNAIQAALTARAAGGCATAPAQQPARAGNGSVDVVARLPSVTAPTSAGVPLPLVVLATLAAGGALGGAIALVRAARRSPGDGHRAADHHAT